MAHDRKPKIDTSVSEPNRVTSCFLNQPSSPTTPRPEANSGRVAGIGTRWARAPPKIGRARALIGVAQIQQNSM